MNAYTLEPEDLLFFRDGRPTATAGGHGARWPEPSGIFDALHAALHRAFPEPQPWEHSHRFGRSSDRDMTLNRTQRFGSLVTAGLFPVASDGRWLFPAPADTVFTTETSDSNSSQPEKDPTRADATSADARTDSDDNSTWLLRPIPVRGKNNLPASFLKFAAGNFAPPTKETGAPWWSAAAWQAYLEGNRPEPAELFVNDDLFGGEWTTGIGIDPESQTQDGRRIYSAEYLRLRPDVRCGFLASLRMKRNGGEDRTECIAHLFKETRTIMVGGQQRQCRVEPVDRAVESLLPMGKSRDFEDDGAFRVKWVLLSPAIWPRLESEAAHQPHPGGWLPSWICPRSGKVLLRHRSGKVRRVWDENRKRTVRQAENETDIDACLVGACVPKPVPVTGWTERLHLLKEENHWTSDDTGKAHGPRPTYLAVPAGAVYYFEAKSGSDAERLAEALNWHGTTAKTEIRNRRSALLGEKGFGLGVCASWKL
jgi:CRISPR-associated protein Cmr3